MTLLRAGPLSCLFEDGGLRYVRWGAREVLRRVYAAVRDRNWDTVPATLSDLRVDARDDRFDVSFVATCRRGEIHFVWKGTIRGDARGTIAFSMDGEAKSSFLRNRIGFCVLHPIRECAGLPATVEKVNGALTHARFPRYVYAHQPFKDMRAITHEVAPGLRAAVRMEGDVFEMEDQRNWTDASYKTYSTPLALPFPVRVEAGARVVQSVTLALEGAASLPPPPRPASPQVSVGAVPGAAIPRLGLGVAGHGRPLLPRELALLRLLRLSHLRVDVRPARGGAETALQRAAVEARALAARLEVGLHLTNAASDELKGVLETLGRVEPPLRHWLVFHEQEKSTTEKYVVLARNHLIPFHPDVLVGAGTDAYFAELNRGDPPTRHELVCYSANPQVHAFDDATLVENLEGLASTVESARLIAGELPLAVTPVTFRPRFNPNATDPASGAPPEPDPRQQTGFGAAWTLGAIKALAQPGVQAATFYETSGPSGVLEGESVFPLFHVLADVGEFAGGQVLPAVSNDPLVVEALAVARKGAVRILVANLTAEARPVRVESSLLRGPARVRVLDAGALGRAASAPEAYRAEPGRETAAAAGVLELELGPHAVARIDV